eukprot:5477612-Alexandrium_andersonii.AAC.1
MREVDDSCIPVYDACAILGTAIAQDRGARGDDDAGYTITLRPTMSYFHRVEGKLHGNVLTALRRDRYPIARSMFEEVYLGSGDT